METKLGSWSLERTCTELVNATGKQHNPVFTPGYVFLPFKGKKKQNWQQQQKVHSTGTGLVLSFLFTTFNLLNKTNIYDTVGTFLNTKMTFSVCFYSFF